MLGVVKLFVRPVPDCSGEPPDAALYQLNVPDVKDEANKVTVPLPHRLSSVVVRSFTMEARTTVLGNDTHVPLSNST